MKYVQPSRSLNRIKDVTGNETYDFELSIDYNPAHLDKEYGENGVKKINDEITLKFTKNSPICFPRDSVCLRLEISIFIKKNWVLNLQTLYLLFLF